MEEGGKEADPCSTGVGSAVVPAWRPRAPSCQCHRYATSEPAQPAHKTSEFPILNRDPTTP